VGLCVARSTVMGNAKASERGMSNRYSLPRFFVYGKFIVKNIRRRERLII